MTESILNRLNKRFSYKPSDERKIIIDFFDTYYNSEELNKSCFVYQCDAINELTKNRKIRELTSKKIFTEELFSNPKYARIRQYAYTFIIYLCEHNVVPNTCLYRILNIKDLIYPTTLQTVVVVNNYLSLSDEQYDSFNKLYKNVPKAQRKCYLLYNLDECIFSDKKLYNQLNQYLTKLKFQLKDYQYANYSILLRNSIKIISELLLECKNSIEIDSFLQLLNNYKNKSRKIFLDIIKIFLDCNYFTSESVKQFDYLINKMGKNNNIYKSSLSAMKKVIASGNIDYCLFKYDKQPLFCYCSDSEKRKALKHFIEYYKNILVSQNICFLEEFDKSLLNPSAPLSFYTYLEQIKYFKDRGNLIKKTQIKKYYYSIFGIIHAFYSFYQNNYDKELFYRNGYSTTLLNRCGIANYIAKGYTVINYNQLESIPKEDKWILCYKYSKTSTVNMVKIIDFTFTQNETFKQWSKYYIWYDSVSINQKIDILFNIKKAFIFIDSIKQRKINSFYVTDITASDKISLQEVRAYKNYILSNYDNVKTQYNSLYDFKRLLNLLSLNNIAKFENGIFIELKYLPVSNNYGNAKPIPNKDLENISREISILARKNTINKIYQIVFYLLIETEFRFSQIANLSVNCVRKTAKDNEYVLFSETKTSRHDGIEQPITIFTKKCIDEALRLTSEYRKLNNNASIKDLLFVVPHRRKKGAFVTLHNFTFNKFLKDICKKLNLESYTICNLRDTHMTKSEEYIIKQHLSDIQLGILTSHSSSVLTRKHYSQPDIIEMLEASNKVIIGDVNLQGQIINKVPDNIKNKENLVSDGCGYCSADKCNITSELSCMLCKDFVTTLNRKPYFEEQLKLIDSIIATKELPHDKEDLRNRKRLILGYLDAIISMEQELENEYRE